MANQYRNGTAWVNTAYNLAATMPTAPDTNWEVTTALPTGEFLVPSLYRVEEQAKDAADNIGTCSHSSLCPISIWRENHYNG